MKKCCYCGRDNEDDALHCHECGTDEFYPGTSSKPSEPMIMTCKRCGAKSDIAGVFFVVHGTFQTSIFCPICWEKHKKFDYLKIFIFRLGLGSLGIFLLSRNHNNPIGWFVLNIFVFDLALSLSIVPHEFAHAFTAKWMGWRVFRIFIGSGKTIVRATIAGFETEFRVLPLNGLVVAAPQRLKYFRTKLFVFTLAGPAANLAIAVLMLLALSGTLAGHGSMMRQLLPLHMILFANLLMALSNLWPRRFNTPLGQHDSDGRGLLEALRANAERQKRSHAGLFYLEGAVRHERKQFAEGLVWVEKGLQLYPDDLNLQMISGLTLLHLQEYVSARDVFLKILARRSETESSTDRISMALAANNVAYTDALIGGPELVAEADKYSAEALHLLSWMPSVKGTRGTVLLELGRSSEAIPFLIEAMQAHDVRANKAENACWLAIAEARQGNLNTAGKYLDQARSFDPTCFLIERGEKALANSGR